MPPSPDSSMPHATSVPGPASRTAGKLVRAALALLSPTAVLAAGALPPASCSSDGQPQPAALLERFTSADCETCWSDRRVPATRRGEIALDWVVPSARGDDAALSAVARTEARERLERLGRPGPAPMDSLRTPVARTASRVRVAHGLALADYIGASIALQPVPDTPRQAWLVLVERIPAGVEGSAVPRQLVRAVFRPAWDALPADGAAASAASRLFESRSLRVPEGAKEERLAVVGWVEDAAGRVLAAAQSSCAPRRGKR